MLASEKVDQFYAFLKDKRYAERSPDMIVIISPNHYHQHSTSPQTICETSDIYFKNKKYTMTPFPNVACDEEIFYPFGNGLTTREHGIGEHLQRITTYFPDTKQIIPLILPTHREPPQVAYPPAKAKRSEVVQNCGREGAPQDCGAGGGLINKEILFIASVDFSHYLPETTALANDKTSISTLQS
ncbi:MAG: hypothetical protein LBU27_08780 [Candidatus Peribacteria bacterium]|jgi:predicted class III extradiol MEMO1 family dioxygenase|nr:hypothetical protein [Candidatus Peribacteria bacterium]